MHTPKFIPQAGSPDAGRGPRALPINEQSVDFSAAFFVHAD
jgi:hypothetical protein